MDEQIREILVRLVQRQPPPNSRVGRRICSITMQPSSSRTFKSSQALSACSFLAGHGMAKCETKFIVARSRQ
jgi:hypothetical protein